MTHPPDQPEQPRQPPRRPEGEGGDGHIDPDPTVAYRQGNMAARPDRKTTDPEPGGAGARRLIGTVLIIVAVAALAALLL